MYDVHSSQRTLHRFIRTFNDPSVRTKFLPDLTSDQISAVNEKLPAVHAVCAAWVRDSGVLDDTTLLPACVIKIAQFPDLPIEAIVTAASWEVWVFAVDDLLDRGTVPFNQIEKLSEECYRIAVSPGNGGTAVSDLGNCFLDIKRQLARHETFADLQPTFSGALMKLLEGMMYVSQRDLRSPENRSIPPLEEYLYHATNSHSHPFFWALPLYNDGSVLDWLDPLCELVYVCARVCRLANDASTDCREDEEGVLNAVGIVLHANRLNNRTADGDSMMQRELAKHEVLTLLDQERIHAHQLASRISTSSRIEASFVRLMELTISAYGRGDVRDWKKLLSGADGF